MKKLVFILAVSLFLGISLLTYSSSATEGRKLLGHWVDRSLYVGATYKMYVEHAKIHLSRKFTDGSGGVIHLVRTATSTYKQVDDMTGDYFVINERGNLEVWDAIGLVVTLSPVK